MLPLSSRCQLCYNIHVQAYASMRNLEDEVNERVSFLKEQISPNNKPIVNETFQAQIEILRNADRQKVALLILQKRKHLEIAKSIRESDRLITEIEALEWLQRQVVKHIA
jgi:hypothetical protein